MGKSCGLVRGRKKIREKNRMLALEMGKMLRLMGSRKRWEMQQIQELPYRSFCPFASSEF